LLDIADSNGDYPLHLCVLENLLDMMVTLLREGADPLMVNTRGETPLTVAVDVQAEPEMIQILEQAEQEAREQAVELKAAELEAEAEVLLEQGDPQAAKDKWGAAAELYSQLEARDEEQACRDKIKSLSGSAASTPKSAVGAGSKADEAAVVEGGSMPSSFSKLKKRLLGSEPAPNPGRPAKILGKLPGGYVDDDDDDDAQHNAADRQVTQALEKLTRISEEKSREHSALSGAGHSLSQARPASGGSLQRGQAWGASSGSRRDVDPSSGKSGTWVGDVFYSDDDEEGDEDESPPRPPPPVARPGLSVPAARDDEEEEFEEVEVDTDQGEMLVQHVMAQAGLEVQGAQGKNTSSMKRGGLLRQLQGLGKAASPQPQQPPSPARVMTPGTAAQADSKRQASPLSQQHPSPTHAIGRSPSQVRAERTRAAARTQQKFAREWGGEWGAYRDSQYVSKMKVSQTVEALLKVLQAQQRLLVVADGIFADGKGAAEKLQALSTLPHL
jgi:hypothetical protein